MNRTQLVCLLVAILIVLGVFGWMHGRSHHATYLLANGRMIGEELIATTNSTRLVNLGAGLRNRLAELLRSPARLENVTLGDDPDIGGGHAEAVLVIGNQQGLQLGIRIRQAEAHDKFHLLGYWTIAEGRLESE